MVTLSSLTATQQREQSGTKQGHQKSGERAAGWAARGGEDGTDVTARPQKKRRQGTAAGQAARGCGEAQSAAARKQVTQAPVAEPEVAPNISLRDCVGGLLISPASDGAVAGSTFRNVLGTWNKTPKCRFASGPVKTSFATSLARLASICDMCPMRHWVQFQWLGFSYFWNPSILSQLLLFSQLHAQNFQNPSIKERFFSHIWVLVLI